MRIARVMFQEAIWIGLVNPLESSIQLIAEQQASFDPTIAFIENYIDKPTPDITGKVVSFSDVTFLPPIEKPSKNVICVGKNYIEHAKEFSGSGYDSSASDKNDVIPDAPIMFSKAPGSMVGAYEDVLVPWDLSSEIDYEAELGVIIGRGGRSIPEQEAYEHVFGYTIINDITARDLQSRHKQWLLGKSIDTFCPIGPWIVTADELDPENLQLNCWVNGERRQHANTSDLIFNIPNIIATASASMALSPGDIIATGTPVGVGIGFTPPCFLKSGDVVKVEISNIGVIENTIV
ncbi:MAG: hydrolase [Gammaproteobacteria bacterium]|nr:hydrolase [Gammaproteobacteria bacterium]